jgi:hypothetical protein
MKRYFDILVIFSCILFVVIACFKIKYPGINSDELLFVNAVRGFGPDSIFVRMRIGNIPFMLNEYIGALKSYLYFPIFAVFGYSVETIRIPMVLLSALSIWIFYQAVILLSNHKTLALLSAILMAFDPATIILTRTDQGPVAIELFLKTLAILFLGKYINSGKIKYLWFLGIAFSLGTFNKLNFIWSVNAILFASIVYWKNVLDYFKTYSIKQKINLVIALLFTYLPSFSLFIWAKEYFNLSVKNPGVTFWLYGFPAHERVWYLVRGMLSFELPLGFGMYIPTGQLAQFSIYLNVILISIAGILVLVNLKKNDSLHKLWLYMFLGFAAISAQLYLTWRAISVWHAINIFPFVICLLITSIFVIYKYINQFKMVLKWSFVFVFIYFIGIRAILIRRYMINLEKPVRSVHWSNKIYDLTDYVNNSNKKIILVDWGTLTQLKSFSSKPQNIIEPLELRQQLECIEFSVHDYNPELFYQKYLKNTENTIFLSMGDIYQFNQSLRQQEFLKLLKKKQLTLKTEKIFKEDSLVSYGAYSVVPLISKQ